MRTLLLAAALALLAALPACKPTTPLFESPVTAEQASAPPEDFWLSVTVLGPIRSGGPPAYDALPRVLRPGRYVVEPDRQLRAALGPGATDASFPPATRRLTSRDLAELYRICRAADLLNAAHPNTASMSPDPETIIGKTVYAITTHAAGKRVMLVMEADPDLSEGAKKAEPVIDWLAARAWIAPATPTSSN